MEPTPHLLERFRGGDVAAYETLFQRYRTPLERFLQHKTLGAEAPLLDDLVQETHAAALSRLRDFEYRRELSFFFWLCSIGRNLVVDHHRRRGVEAGAGVVQILLSARTSSEELWARVADSGQSPLDQVTLAQHLHVLGLALDALPDRRRDAVMLRYFDGLDSEAAAAALGTSPGAFRVLLSRALSDLKRALGELLGESRH